MAFDNARGAGPAPCGLRHNAIACLPKPLELTLVSVYDFQDQCCSIFPQLQKSTEQLDFGDFGSFKNVH